jgi:hypothetical protein
MPKVDDFYNHIKEYLIIKTSGEISNRCQALFVLQDKSYICHSFNPEINMTVVYTVDLTERMEDDIDTCQRN